MGSNNPCSKWATPTNSLKRIWGALRALQGPHLAPWRSVEAIACLCQPRCFCAVGNEFSLWIYIRTDQWGQFWALNHLIWGHRTNQKTLIWPKIDFLKPMTSSTDPDELYVFGNEFISWRHIRTDHQDHVSALFYLIWSPRALKRPSFVLKLPLRRPLAASVDLGHLFVAEIELISLVYIRPDQWDHIKALYHLIYCPRVNQRALIWPKIAFLGHLDPIWDLLGATFHSVIKTD